MSDDEFKVIDGKWFWIDLDDENVGPFDSEEEARKDAHDNCWLAPDGEGVKLRADVMTAVLGGAADWRMVREEHQLFAKNRETSVASVLKRGGIWHTIIHRRDGSMFDTFNDSKMKITIIKAAAWREAKRQGWEV